MIDLVNLIGRDISIVPDYNEHRVTDFEKFGDGWYTVNKPISGFIIYIKVYGAKNRAEIYDVFGKRYFLYYVTNMFTATTALLDYCKRTNIPYYA